MKRIYILILTALFVFSTGCHEENHSVMEHIKEPPELIISDGHNEISAKMDACSWTCGDSSVEIEGRDPSGSYADVTTITSSEDHAILTFSIEPDVVSCCFWRGNAPIRGWKEELPIDGQGLELISGGGIYEITATWNKSEDFNGQVTYLIQHYDPEVLPYPPKLTVKIGAKTFTPGYGCSGWGVYDEDGNVVGGFVTEMIPTLEAYKLGEVDMVTRETKAFLEFEEEPDSFSVTGWEEGSIGQSNSQGSECLLEDHVLTLKDGSYVYEVKAVWNRPRYGGTVYYSFYITVE